jgi:hypothetical protein
MKRIVMIAAIAALSACNREAAEAPANDMAADANLVVEDNLAANAATPAAMSLNSTTWEYTREGVAYVETIDANGNYITDTADGKHYDHGTVVNKDGKACFTSAMKKDEGESCWTLVDTAVGQTTKTTSDKGETLDVKRVEYRELKMPA